MIRGLGLLVVGGIFAMLLIAPAADLAQGQSPSGTPAPASFPVTVTMTSPIGRDLGTAVITEQESGLAIELALDGLVAEAYELGVRSSGTCEATAESASETSLGPIRIDERGDGSIQTDDESIDVAKLQDDDGSALVLHRSEEAPSGDGEEPFVACGVIFPPAEATPMAGSPAASAETAEVVIVSVDIAFEPNEVVIPANTDVRFILPNDGAILHTFSIDELGIDIFQSPGEVHEIIVNAPPGEYVFYCKIEGHREAGMVGTLIVE